MPEQLELAPTDKGNDGKIKLNEANKKRKEYNEKRKEYNEKRKEYDITTDKRFNNISSPKNYKEYKKFGSFYNKAENILNDALIKNNQNETLDYIKNTINNNILKSFYKIADVPQNKINVIGAKTSSLRLSMETLIKNILHHKELNIENYKKINNYIKTADYVLQESKNSIIFYKIDKILYKISIKTTKNKKRKFFNFLSY